MRSQYYRLKPRVIALRRRGKTYNEICKTIRIDIPQSTLSDWCSDILLSPNQQRRITDLMERGMDKGRAAALIANKLKRERYIQEVQSRVKHLPDKLKNINTAKIALSMLFLGDGSKKTKGSLMFGNSNPLIIALFLSLLRYCYDIDEKKFRCTLQCRADQNVKKLEKFWSQITKIHKNQFYKAKIDPRTIGKPSKNTDYKGVCRIDYFSGDVYMELKQIIELTTKGL